MGAGSDEVEVVVMGVAVMGPHVAQLGQGVAQAVRRAFNEVIPFAPGEGRVIGFKFYVGFQLIHNLTQLAV
jgi:hypothetical protein